MLDRDALLAPVTPGQPSGSLLEYDPAFLSLAEAARGKPEQRMGESVIAGEPPDWGRVERDAVALLARTKDLRVAALLVKARLHGDGVPGLSEGLALVRGLVERHWDTVHPQLDPEDGLDPAMRINALSELADAETVLALRDAEVASARGLGRIRVRDLEPSPRGNGAAAPAAEGEATERGRPPPVEAVLARCDGEALARTAAAGAGGADDARAIEAFVKDKAGNGPSLGKLAALLQRVADVLGPRVSGAAAREAGAGEAAPGVVASEEATPSAGPVTPGAIRSRQDVIAALDGIRAYYERVEPSSPIPLLMRRSKRLVSMSFIDIVRDVMPEALAQAEGLSGRSDTTSHEAGGTTSTEGGDRT